MEYELEEWNDWKDEILRTQWVKRQGGERGSKNNTAEEEAYSEGD